MQPAHKASIISSRAFTGGIFYGRYERRSVYAFELKQPYFFPVPEQIIELSPRFSKSILIRAFLSLAPPSTV